MVTLGGGWYGWEGQAGAHSVPKTCYITLFSFTLVMIRRLCVCKHLWNGPLTICALCVMYVISQ